MNTATMSAPTRERLLAIPGMETTLVQNGRSLPFVESNGYVGDGSKLGENTVFTVHLTVQEGFSFIAIAIDPTSNEPQDLPFLTEPDGTAFFERRISLRQDEKRVCYPDPNTSIIRVVGFLTNGLCIMWNVALISQRGYFFITYQEIFREQAYDASATGGSVELPALDKVRRWKKLNAFLGAKIAQTGVALPPISEFVPKEETYQDGEVMFYSLREQKGAIWTKKGEAVVHWSHVPKRNGLQYVLPGERVTYDLRAVKPQPGNRRQSGFEWEAVNVQLVS